MNLENGYITIPGTDLMVTPTDADGRYTNFDDTTSAQKSDGSNPTQADIDAPTNSIGYVKAMNAIALCGFTDWRLPTREELKVMVWHEEVLGMHRLWYWSSSPCIDDPGYAWGIHFDYGVVLNNDRNVNCRIRLVRDIKEKNI